MKGFSLITGDRSGRSGLNWPIKRVVSFLAALLLALTAAAEGEFARTLTPEELRATGLAKLTPEELAQLEAMVQRYKQGAPAAAPAAPEAQVAAPEAKSNKILPEWVGALITLDRIGRRSDKAEAMESRLAGDFNGWNKRTLFRLENGQQWTQVNDDTYVYTPPLKSPKVKIFPASFGTFWLEVEGVNQRCRIKPVKLE